MKYIHQLNPWPELHWDAGQLSSLLASVRHRQGHLLGQMKAQGFRQRAESGLANLTSEIVKSCAIEGEMLDAEQVRSSIARHLGMDAGGLLPAARSIDGMVEMMLDATQHYNEPLTEKRLCAWHAALFPTGRSGMRDITVGAWRTGPMYIVSGGMGYEKIHYEAPAAGCVQKEMSAFLSWFNAESATDPVVKAALAHFWFVTIHPFDDGNGRIGRAIAELALARADQTSERFYSMSSQIETERKAYYAALEFSQKGTLDITRWMEWFLECLGRTFDRAEETLAGVMKKARIWEKINQSAIHERQRIVINRLLDGFEGNLTTSKYATLAKCSTDTALRDINELLERGILDKNPAGGRSTCYHLIEPSADS
ncbi:MAG: Fic family protein [Kiritimatiellaceae bacterium]|nr:Fic family protein [Kiritimatiellaceae bacterium]